MFLAILLLLAPVLAVPASAGEPVTNCANDTDFSGKLSGGGAVTFNCGTATILFSSTKTIAAHTTIDGGGNITLNGGFGYRWIGPDCAKTFSVVVRQGSKTGPIVFSKSNIKATQVKTTALPKNQKLFWQVTACKGAQCTASSWGKFTVK